MTHNIVKLSNLLTQLLTRVHSGKLMCWNFGMCIGVKYMFSLQANKLLYLGTKASQEYVLLSPTRRTQGEAVSICSCFNSLQQTQSDFNAIYVWI